MNSKVSYNLELDHGMGYNGSIPNSLILHPNLVDYIYIAGGVIVLAEMNDPNKQKLLRGHDDEVTCITLSTNGKLLASGQKGENSDILVWNYETHKIIFTLSEHDYEVSFLQFSKDNHLLYSNGNIQDKKIFIWDMNTGCIVANYHLFPSPVNYVSWGGMIKDQRGLSTDYYQLAACGNKSLCLWQLDPYKGFLEKELVQTGNFVREYICLAFSLNEEKFIYGGTTSGDIVCFLVKNRSVVFSKIICAQGVTALVPLTKNQIVVGGGDGSLVLLYVDEPKCEELARVQLYGSIYSLSSSADGVQLLASTDKGFIYRIRAADLSNILLNENHTDSIVSFYSLNDSEYRFGTTSLDGTVRLWNLHDYSVWARIFISPSIFPTSLEFTNEMLVTGWSDGRVRCNRTDNQQPLWAIDNAHKDGVSTLCISNNEKFICTGGTGGEVRIWEIRSKDMMSHLKEHISKVTKVQIFSNDVHLLTTAKDKSILIWDLAKEKRITSYQLVGGVNNFQLSPVDENILVTVGQDRKVTQWDLRDPKPIHVISSNPYNKIDQADELFGLAISNDGKYLATGGSLGIIRVYDLNNSMSFLTENFAHSKTITALSYTKDDRYLISCGEDSLILSFTAKLDKIN